MDDQTDFAAEMLIAAQAGEVDVLDPHAILHVIVGVHRAVRAAHVEVARRDLIIAQRDQEIARLNEELAQAQAKPKRKGRNEPVEVDGHRTLPLEGKVAVPAETIEAVRRAKELANGKEPAHADA